MSILSALKISRRPAAAFAIVGLFWGCFAALVPVLKAQIGASDGLFGVLLLGTGIGLTSSIWLAPRIERLLGAPALMVASLVFAATFVLPSIATGPLMFGLFLVLLGVTSGLTDVVMNARVSTLEVASRRSLMNANHGMFSASYAVAALLTGFAREAGWTPAAVFSVAALVAVALALTTKQELPVEEVELSVGKSSLFWPVLLCGGVTLIAFMSEATVESWSALHIERTLLGGAAQGAMGPAALGLTMAIGRFSGQVIIERTSEYLVIRWATLLSIIGVLIAATAPTPLIAYLGFGIMGLGISVIGPMALALVGRLVRRDVRTEAISKVAVIGFAGFFVAPVLMGFISEGFGLRIAFASVALLLALVIPLIIMVKRLPMP
ncbi:MAG: MFS transporter [Marinosulfonomonas sp.]|nr:MAG: MFS transporter [Marinosulfonomonas sp.]